MRLFVIQIFWVFIQTRRQDLAAEGTKNHKGETFWNAILDVCSNRGANYEMGTHILNGGKAPLAMALFLLYEYGFILVCNLSLFEITEWEPCMWLLNTDIFAGYAARQWHCWQR